MFIKNNIKKVGEKIYSSTLLVEGYKERGKVKHNTLANLTQWPKGVIDEFKKILKGGKVNMLDDLEEEQGKAIGAIYVFYQIAKQLGIIKALGSACAGRNDNNARLTLAMIFGRILNQGSRLSLVSWQNDEALYEVIGLEEFNEDQLYYAMDWLHENQEQIERKIFTYRYKDKTSNFYLYDVTSSYLEGLKNELAEYGYNRDGKRGKKQIVIGLLTDSEGMPIAVRVFSGNKADHKTVEAQLEILANKFNVKNLILVGDRGMVKKDQQKEISSKKGWYWVTSITKPEIDTLINKNKFQLELFQEEVAEVIDGDIRYIIRRNPIRASEIKANREDILAKFRSEVEKKNEYLKKHPKAKEDIAKRNLMDWITRRKLKDFISVLVNERCISFSIDEGEYIKKGELDGCYAIKTNVPHDIANKEEIHGRYKDLKEVENDFRDLKTFLLEIRPIFHRKAERTRALAFIAMLALMIVRIFEKKTKELKITTVYKIKALDRIQYNKITLASKTIKKIPNKLTKIQEEILSKLKITPPRFLPIEVVTK